ncbi:hypothetical protein HYPSUDRAFT_199256 [Hypholoma sublateritium FD-334 SS-4]|uniref:Uncharacterized protein n=1 Tax=Hypholoma sublateritium (strain FD-334 SS-4) TaxID=945553 RepID=A0A0D2P532_HYPSF|nr:hypothetical protein HYPSUDRAFT_199256 [Hypholoma sublateritium FD-334 SS-4]
MAVSAPYLSIVSLSPSSSLRSLFAPSTSLYPGLSAAPKTTTPSRLRARAAANACAPPLLSLYVRARTALLFLRYSFFHFLHISPAVVCHNHVLFIPSQFNYGSVLQLNACE